jgi:hypothetical protein
MVQAPSALDVFEEDIVFDVATLPEQSYARSPTEAAARLWQRPHVKVGGRYATPPGQIVGTRVFEVSVADVTPELARQSGCVPEHVVQFYQLLGGGLRDAGWQREHMSRARLVIIPDVTHYEMFSRRIAWHHRPISRREERIEDLGRSGEGAVTTRKK